MRQKVHEVEVIARALVLRNDTVLVCRSRKHGHCFLPGGHVDFGETARAALRRELQEEAGLRCKVGAFLGACEQVFEQRGKARHEYSLVFHVELSPKIRVVSRETKIEFTWMSIDGARKSLLPRAMGKWIAENPRGPWIESVRR